MMRRLVALVALLEVTLAKEFFKNIPKLYLSAQDLSPAYIDFSKYFDMTRTVNPMLSTSTPEAITLIQPFQNFTVATPAKIEETMGYQSGIGAAAIAFDNCTAASSSSSEYSVAVCNNVLFIFSVNTTKSKSPLIVPTDGDCAFAGDLLCQNVILQNKFMFGLAICLKVQKDKTPGVTAAVVYPFLLSDSQIVDVAKPYCTKIPSQSNGDNIIDAKAALVDLTFSQTGTNNNYFTLALIIAGNTANPDDPQFESLVKYSFTFSVRSNILYPEPASAIISTKKLSEIITGGNVLVRLVGSTSTRIVTETQSNLILISKVSSSSSLVRGISNEDYILESYYIYVNPKKDKYSVIKKIAQSYSNQFYTHLDDFYFYEMNFRKDINQITVKVIDSFSYFSGDGDTDNSITHFAVNIFIDKNYGDILKSVLGFSTASMAAFSLDFDSCQYALIIDINKQSTLVKNITNFQVGQVSLSETNGEPIAMFNYFNSTLNEYAINGVGSARAYIGVKISNTADFSYPCSIYSNDLLVNDFNITGTVIRNMSNYIEVIPGFFAQNFSYYFNLSYNMFLPWDYIRGADIQLEPKFPIEGISLNAFKHVSQDIVLQDYNLTETPDSYFIRDDFLVIFFKTDNDPDCPNGKKPAGNDPSTTILIFSKVRETELSLTFKLATAPTFSCRPTLDTTQTSLRDVEVFYDNVLVLLEMAYCTKSGAKLICNYYAMLHGFFGPNFLISNYTVGLEFGGFSYSLQPKNETNCYLVLCSNDKYLSKTVNKTFVSIYDVLLENVLLSRLEYTFNSSSNVQPPLHAVFLFPDLVDSKYLIIKSQPLEDISPKATMRLDLHSMTMSEYQKERLIDKSGMFCPTKESFVKVKDKNLLGYNFPPSKSIYNLIQFYIDDLDLSPEAGFDFKCLINENVVIIGQNKNIPSRGKIYVIYIFLTDMNTDADKRLTQRIVIEEEITSITFTAEGNKLFLHYSTADSTKLGRLMVYLTKTIIMVQKNTTAEYQDPTTFTTSLNFTTLNRAQTKSELISLNYETPAVIANLTKKSNTYIVNKNKFNNSNLDNLISISGPVYNINFGTTNPNITADQLPQILDLTVRDLAGIRAPIFDYFNILLMSGNYFIGIVNYPYGFDICVLDSQFLQDPSVASFSNVVAMSAEVRQIGETIYLFVLGQTMGDPTVKLMTYSTTVDNLYFNADGMYVSDRLAGELSVQLVSSEKQSFLVTIYSKSSAYCYAYLLNYRSINSAYSYSIIPDYMIPSTIQLNVIPIANMSAIYFVYRKVGQFDSLYYSVYDRISETLSEPRVACEGIRELEGANEKLKCQTNGPQTSAEATINCILIVEGTNFTDVSLAATRNKFPETRSQPSIGELFSLNLTSTRVYKHYMNSMTERIDFSDNLIVLQTTVKERDANTNSSLSPQRHMMVFRRDTQSIYLYKGINCSLYSETCDGSVDIIFSDLSSFFVASQADAYLIMEFTIGNRIVSLPSGYNNYNSSDLTIELSSPYTDPAQDILSNLVQFDFGGGANSFKFEWVYALIFLAGCLLPVIVGTCKEAKRERDEADLIDHVQTFYNNPLREDIRGNGGDDLMLEDDGYERPVEALSNIVFKEEGEGDEVAKKLDQGDLPPRRLVTIDE